MTLRFLSSLRLRLIVLVALGLLPLVGFYAYQKTRLAEDAEASWSDHLDRALLVARDRHERLLRDLQNDMATLSKVRGLAAAGAYVCAEVLEDFHARRPYLTAVGVLAPDGWVRCTVPVMERFRVTLPYVATARRERRPAVSAYHIGTVTGRPVVTLALPLLAPDSTVAGILAAGIDLRRVALLPEGLQLRPRAAIAVFDTTGVVIQRLPAGDTAVGLPVPDGLLTARDSAGDVTVRDIDGVDRTFRVVAIHGTDGRVAAYAAAGYSPEYVAGQLAGLARSDAVGFAVTAVLLLGMLGLTLELGLVRRLHAILRATRRIGSGDLSARTGVRPGRNEVSRLAGVVDQMAANLEVRREEEARKARRDVQETEERFRQLANAIQEVFWIWDIAEERIVYLSPGYERVWGRPRTDILDHAEGWRETIHPEDRAYAAVPWTHESGQEEREYRILLPDGKVRWIHERAFAVRGQDGRVVRYAGIAADITGRRALQDTLRQSTKLEAVGRLAGGVAHDFNNVLTAIQGHAQLALQDVPDDSPIRADLEEIDRAAERAAGLTRQLLAFSRKQQIQPVTLDLNEVVRGLEGMLRRLLGEDMTLESHLAPDLWPIRADINQMEQVLINLCANARDAMPGGGTLSISTHNRSVHGHGRMAVAHGIIPPGDWVWLSVKDTGVGMDEETITRIFEPFYTTKAKGRGTGLGLARVYGTVRQGGGYIWVESEPGRGAEFAIYLPRGEQPPSGASDENRSDEAEASREEGRILLVEDEDAVRSIARRSLERLGYDVVEAAHGREALVRFEENAGGFDLVLTDVVMPGMSGPQLWCRIREREERLRVVFMSGYLGHQALDAALTGPDAPLLQKPFTAEQLGRAVRTALASPRV